MRSGKNFLRSIIWLQSQVSSSITLEVIKKKQKNLIFLDASSHLYKPLCLSVGPSVRRGSVPTKKCTRLKREENRGFEVERLARQPSSSSSPSSPSTVVIVITVFSFDRRFCHHRPWICSVWRKENSHILENIK